DEGLVGSDRVRPTSPNYAAAGASKHGLHVFFRRMYRYRPDGLSAPPSLVADYHELWDVHFMLDAAEFGGEPGEALEVRKVTLDFEVDYTALPSPPTTPTVPYLPTGSPSVLSAINGVSYD